MDPKNLAENLIAGILCTALCAISKAIYGYIKREESDITPPKTVSPAKTLQKQFLISLFVLVLALPTACMLPIHRGHALTAFIRVFLFIVAGYAFLLVWGAFDAAFAFYPAGNVGDDSPANDATDHSPKE